MANVKITALEHISSFALAPEDVFVIDDVSTPVTKKVTIDNVSRYISNATTNILQNNLNAFASYANANAASLALAIASIDVSSNLSFSSNSGTGSLEVSTDTLIVVGEQGIHTNASANTITISMTNTSVVAGEYGGASGTTSQIPSIVVDSTGRIISAQNVELQVDFASTEANINSVASNVGVLADLVTSEKSNLVAAINEAATSTVTDTITLDDFTIDSTKVSNVSSVGETIFIMNKNNKFAKLLINVDDLTYGQQQSSEILLVQDSNEVKITEYAIIYNSTNPIATFDAAISGDNVVLNAKPVSSDNIIKVFKILT